MQDKTYAEQLKGLFIKAKEELGYPIVLGLQIYDKPGDDEKPSETDYPFVGYNIMSQRRVANIQFSEEKERDIHIWWEEQYEFILSFVAVAESPYDSLEAAKELFEWLSIKGQDYMSEKQIVFISATPITNRDFLLINNYERRNGFDCRLRMGRRIEKDKPMIEKVFVSSGEFV